MELVSTQGFFFPWLLVTHAAGFFSIALIMVFLFSSQDNYRNCFLGQL